MWLPRQMGVCTLHYDKCVLNSIYNVKSQRLTVIIWLKVKNQVSKNVLIKLTGIAEGRIGGQ